MFETTIVFEATIAGSLPSPALCSLICVKAARGGRCKTFYKLQPEASP